MLPAQWSTIDMKTTTAIVIFNEAANDRSPSPSGLTHLVGAFVFGILVGDGDGTADGAELSVGDVDG